MCPFWWIPWSRKSAASTRTRNSMQIKSLFCNVDRKACWTNFYYEIWITISFVPHDNETRPSLEIELQWTGTVKEGEQGHRNRPGQPMVIIIDLVSNKDKRPLKQSFHNGRMLKDMSYSVPRPSQSPDPKFLSWVWTLRENLGFNLWPSGTRYRKCI